MGLLNRRAFPFLFGGTFIEGRKRPSRPVPSAVFPFLFGGTFIEGTAVFCGLGLI